VTFAARRAAKVIPRSRRAATRDLILSSRDAATKDLIPSEDAGRLLVRRLVGHCEVGMLIAGHPRNEIMSQVAAAILRDE